MKKINAILRKCKTLSRQLSRTSLYSSLRSKSTRDQDLWQPNDQHWQTILLGSSKRPYVIATKYLKHPLVNVLIEKSKLKQPYCEDHDHVIKCEVVFFDHLLWMLENADPSDLTSDSFEELAELYVF